MKRHFLNSQQNCILFIVISLLLFFISACEEGGFPIIHNQRNQELRILVTLLNADGPLQKPDEPTDYGVVPAQTTKKLASITFVKREWVYQIQAVDPTGKVVFSHDYNMDDLEKIGWKITIPP